MTRKLITTLAVVAVWANSGTLVQADEFTTGTPTEITEPVKGKKARLQARRAERKEKRAARKAGLLAIQPAVPKAAGDALVPLAQSAALPAPVTASPDPAPAGRPSQPKPVIIPPAPPAPAPVFSES